MSFPRGYKVAASAVNSLRVKSLLDEVPKTEIAERTGVTRLTVAKRLKRKDMSLSAFIDTADAIGADPLKIWKDALADKEEKK
jgi:DNA invertase Pin-like site-specific DNA recombinase